MLPKCQKHLPLSSFTTMKSLAKILAAFILIAVTFAAASAAHTAGDKAVNKAREMVANAGPDDWKTYALAAEKCIEKNSNMAEANEWIDKSLKINENPLNLRIKGDYFRKNNLEDKAIEMYVKAVAAAGNSNEWAGELTAVQDRIRAIRYAKATR